MTPGSLFTVHTPFLSGQRGYMPTEAARSPWSLELLHGGPVAGLLAHAAEQLVDDDGLRLARLSTDLFRPIPFAPLSLATTLVRDGGRLKMVSLSLTARRPRGDDATPSPPGDQTATPSPLGDQTIEVCRAQALFLRSSDVDASAGDTLAPPLPFIEMDRPPRLSGDTAYHNTVIFRHVNEWGSGEPAATWVHVPVPLLPSTELSPAALACAISDFVSPMANSHSPPTQNQTAITFINADITTYLHRPPQGEWIGLTISDRGSDQGIAVGAGVLHDRRGPFGRAMAASIAQNRQPLGGGNEPSRPK